MSLLKGFLVISVCFFMAAGIVAGEEDKDLVGLWHFDEKGDMAKDSSGRGHDGKISGAVRVDGISGQSLQFDGLSNYVEIPDSPDWTWQPDTSFALEVWIKTGAPGAVIATYNPGPPSRECFGLSVSDGKIVFGFRDMENKETEYRGPKVDDNNWHQVVFVRDRANKKLDQYIDGKLIGSIPDATIALIDSEYPLTIGSLSVERKSFFKGLIDEVRIYKRVLSLEEVDAHYKMFSRQKTGEEKK